MADGGFAVTPAAYGLPTAVEAVRGDGPLTVIVCAEYDALPGIGHACGHNVIAASSVGAALALGALADELGLRVVLLGTPAEEGAGGKIELLARGAFERGHLAVMAHPGPLTLLARTPTPSRTCTSPTRARLRMRPPTQSSESTPRMRSPWPRWRSRCCVNSCRPTPGCTGSSPMAVMHRTPSRATPKAAGTSAAPPRTRCTRSRAESANASKLVPWQPVAR